MSKTAVVDEAVARISAASFSITPASVTADYAVTKDEDPVLTQPEVYCWIAQTTYDRISRCEWETNFALAVGVRAFCKHTDNTRLEALLNFTEELSELFQTWTNVADYAVSSISEDMPFDLSFLYDSNQFQQVTLLTMRK
jgi:hypothetical protein